MCGVCKLKSSCYLKERGLLARTLDFFSAFWQKSLFITEVRSLTTKDLHKCHSGDESTPNPCSSVCVSSAAAN